MVTLKDIADYCNVSVTAVSLVLNNKPNRFSSETKKKIINAAKELNYSPNHVALSLVKGKSHMIGLIIPDIKNEYFSNLAFTVENSLSPHSYTMMLGNSNNEAKKDILYAKNFLGYKADGLIIVSSSNYSENEWKEMSSLLNTSQTPIVFLDRSPLENIFPFFVTNNVSGGYIATKHLLSLGHRRIGVLTGPPFLKNTQDRLLGYEMALREFDLNLDKNLLFEGNFTVESGEASFHYFITKGVSAIFSFNDMMAYGLFRSAQNTTTAIPDDLSVVGFDNNTIGTISNPSLTTISQPIDEMCFQSTQYLMSKIYNTKTTLDSKQYEPKLIIRNSTLPPKNIRK